MEEKFLTFESCPSWEELKKICKNYPHWIEEVEKWGLQYEVRMEFFKYYPKYSVEDALDAALWEWDLY